MLRFQIDEKSGSAVVHPDEIAGLSASDFDILRDQIDSYIDVHGDLKGLVIVMETFPGWESFNAFVSHIRFVRDHHRLIGKVALVSDDRALAAAPAVVDHFVRAKVRHFERSELEKAKVWAAEEDAPTGGFTVLDGYPADVVAVRADGTITGRDYDKTLVPLIEKRLASHDKIKFLFWCGDEFEGFSAGAIWDDMRLGLMHLGDFSKIALVSDAEWLRQSVKVFAPLMRAEIQVFHNARADEAREWIVGEA